MKKIFLLILIIIPAVVFSQSNYTNILQRYRWVAGAFDSTLHAPIGSSASLRTGGAARGGALFVDSVGADSGLHVYFNSTWHQLASAASVTGVTWQQALTNGSTLTGANTITGGGFNWTWNNSGNWDLNFANTKTFNIDLGTTGSLGNIYADQNDIYLKAGVLAAGSHAAYIDIYSENSDEAGYIDISHDGNLFSSQIYMDRDEGIKLSHTQNVGHVSSVQVYSDSIVLRPDETRLNIDSLSTTTDTTLYKPMVYRASTGQVKYGTYWYGGGGGGSGTVNSGTALKAAYYPASAATVDDWIGVEFNNTNLNTKIIAQNAADVILELKHAATPTGAFLNGSSSTGTGDLFSINAAGEFLLGGVTDNGAYTLQTAGDIIFDDIAPGNYLFHHFTSGAEVIYQSNGGTQMLIIGNASLISGIGVNLLADTYFHIAANATETYRFYDHGAYFGGAASPDAKLEIAAGSATANTAPLKLNTGTKLSTAEAGAFDFDGGLFFTKTNAVRHGVGGTLTHNFTDVGNITTGEDDLMTFSIPAGTLSNDGDFLEFEMTFLGAANANSKTIKIYYGATATYTIPAFTTSGTMVVVRGTVTRTGATTQRITLNYTSDNGTTQASGTLYGTDTETLSGAVTIKATGEATATDDIIQKTLIIKYFPGNPDPS